jgi:GNAT superfamily N-acetyltransferase
MKTYSQFISESQEVLNRISRNWSKKNRGINIDTSHEPKTNSIRLNQLFVPPHLRGQGMGKRIMKGLTRYADKTNQSITLNQAPDPGKKTALQRFYKNQGFTKNAGRNRDFTTRDSYIRRPQQ